jgi:murein DD-endopeptidase MepM/ murein hydrolase activator NlpD
MEIRFDGVQAVAGLRTVNGARFGMTRNGGTRPHQGVDLFARPGTPVHAVADGTIVQVRQAHPSYGRDILLRFVLPAAWRHYLKRAGSADADGIVFAQYAHLGSIHVKLGQAVKAGQAIGSTGTSGNADQRYPHLHFELRKIASPGIGSQGLANRINPELVFANIDYSRPVEAIDQLRRTA